VVLSTLAEEQVAWVEAHTGLDLRTRMVAALSLGPRPQAYRRISREGHGYRLGIKEWRALFTAQDGVITVERIRSGYRPQELVLNADPDRPLQAHRAFFAQWGR
jgi:hypothetical protein